MLIRIVIVFLLHTASATRLGVPVFRFGAINPSGATVYVIDRVGSLEQYSQTYRNSTVVTAEFLDRIETRKRDEGPQLPDLLGGGALLPPCEGRYELTCIEDTGLVGGGASAEEAIIRARKTADVVYTAWKADEEDTSHGNDWERAYPFSVSLVVCILLAYLALALWPVLSVHDIDAFPETEEKGE